METSNLACGAWTFIEHGIERFIHEHGSKPAALILHPAHIKALCDDAGPDRTLLDGVSVIVSPLFELPVLVDAQGDNHEL